MGNRAFPCECCGAVDGPEIYASDPGCSVLCTKFLGGEINADKFKTLSGKKVVLLVSEN